MTGTAGTGTIQNWQVPAGVCQVTITATGAAGSVSAAQGGGATLSKCLLGFNGEVAAGKSIDAFAQLVGLVVGPVKKEFLLPLGRSPRSLSTSPPSSRATPSRPP